MLLKIFRIIVISFILNNNVKTFSVIFFHGIGDNGDTWVPILNKLCLPSTNIICPTANEIPLTINEGNPTRAWFDITDKDIENIVDVDSIKSAVAYAHKVIEKEISAGTPSNRIIIGGFSQGGALALLSGLTFGQKLAGIVALSCWLPLMGLFSESMVTANKNLHVLLCHGSEDENIPVELAPLTTYRLAKVTSKLQFKLYPGLTHTVSEKEMEDVRKFIRRRLYGFMKRKLL